MSSSSTQSSTPITPSDSLTLSKILSTPAPKTALKSKKTVLFKNEHPFDKRKAEADRIRIKYPDRIPVIAEKAEKSDLPDIDKKKYLVPSDLTMGQFVYVIRKRIKLPADQAIFIFVNNILPPAAALMSQIYKEYADADGFVYCKIQSESSFGALPVVQ
ncbi:MAG: hypothetical protein PHG66_04750 [Candidatus Colwellbacteria bacterium]|nr:hypothetical protein [Candidatus Colwellbacteria bacterium]